jgi:hypothetical protein
MEEERDDPIEQAIIHAIRVVRPRLPALKTRTAYLLIRDELRRHPVG